MSKEKFTVPLENNKKEYEAAHMRKIAFEYNFNCFVEHNLCIDILNEINRKSELGDYSFFYHEDNILEEFLLVFQDIWIYLGYKLEIGDDGTTISWRNEDD